MCDCYAMTDELRVKELMGVDFRLSWWGSYQHIDRWCGGRLFGYWDQVAIFQRGCIEVRQKYEQLVPQITQLFPGFRVVLTVN